MPYLLLIIAFINGYTFCSLTPDKQPTGSGSGSAGSAAAVIPARNYFKDLCVDDYEDQSIGYDSDEMPPSPSPEEIAMFEKVEASNKLLDAAKGNWKAQKEIVKKTVEEGIHPDALCCEKYAVQNLRSEAYSTPLAETIKEREEDDIPFARFLLEKNADPNQSNKDCRFHYSFSDILPLFASIQTPAMAQLFYNHGGDLTVQRYGAELLSKIIGSEVNIPMLTWYLGHGFDVNLGVYTGSKTPLHDVVFHCDIDENQSSLQATMLLMRAGVFLDAKAREYGDLTVPQIVKARLEHQYVVPEVKARLGIIRAALKNDSSSRHKLLATATNLIPVLADLVSQYYEPTYEKLETEPRSASTKMIFPPVISELD